MGLGMAKSKAKPVARAKAAKAPAKGKAVKRASAGAALKSQPKASAKKRPVAKPAKKPLKAAAPGKTATKPAAKTVLRKAAVGGKAVAKNAAVKPTKPAKPAPAKKAVGAAPAKSTTSKTTGSPRKFVTTSKPESNTAAKSAKARATPPPSDNGVTMQDGRYALPTTVQIELPNGYKPNAKEEYMSPRQLQYFRSKLSKWREELVEESRQTIESLRDEVRDVGDEAERATRETENSLELRTRDRYRKLIAKIDKALKRIEEGRYGFCEETDEEIGLDRLEARPIATLSLDAQERWEHRQKQMGD